MAKHFIFSTIEFTQPSIPLIDEEFDEFDMDSSLDIGRFDHE